MSRPSGKSKNVAATTITDIARASGYSIKTVSRVINHEPTVAKDIREKVEAAVARLNYQPNVWARALRSSRSHLLALFCTDLTVAYVNQIQLAAAAACQRAGYRLIVETLREGFHDIDKDIRGVLRTIRLDGVLLIPPLSDDLTVLKALKAAKAPFVRVSPYEHLDFASYVHVDDRKAAYDMTHYLLGLGHRDIAFVKGPPEHAAAGQRERGFEAAMSEGGGNLRREWIVPGRFDVQSGMMAGERLLSGRRRPTAILACNDNSAIGVMAAAYSKGIAVPHDLSIVGIDDTPIASSFWPKLTTVRQPLAKLGSSAVEILIHEIETPGKQRAEQLEFKIVVRESTAPPKKAGKGTRTRQGAD